MCDLVFSVAALAFDADFIVVVATVAAAADVVSLWIVVAVAVVFLSSTSDFLTRRWINPAASR